MGIVVEISLSYQGKDADNYGLDFYDASRALIGFQRSLALTTHLILNDEIITQSPSLKGATIIIRPPTEGSWKATALIVVGGLWYGGTVSKDTPIGNLISSAYDYMIDETLGFHVDYSKTLGIQLEEYEKSHPKAKTLSEHRFDSLAEKCTAAVIDMHRPIIFSETASSAKFLKFNDPNRQIGHNLDYKTYEYINYNIQDKNLAKYCGSVAAYSSNAFSGRIFMPSERRLVSFYLSENARTSNEVGKVITSLAINAQQKESHTKMSNICFMGYKVTSKGGRIKRIIVSGVVLEGPV